MIRVKLKLHSLLTWSADSPSPAFNESFISVPKEESVLEMARRLTSENKARETLFDEGSQRIGNEIIVIHNGQVVNDPARTILKEGDEVIFLPYLAGG